MGNYLQIVTPLHKATKRNYLERMNDSKVEAMIVAKQYGFEYWDGDRRYGYGGYKYIPGRWKPVAEALIDHYQLNSSSTILDVGCGKGFLLLELQLLVPGISITGFDISQYALANLHPTLEAQTFIHRAQDPYPFQTSEFDLVISLGTLHNLHIYELEVALKEIERVLREATPQPLPKIIDLRFTLDLIVSKFYIVLLAGKDQRRSPRKHPISNRVTRIGNTTAVIILLLAINLLISVVIIVAVYLLKTIIGIDLTSGGHFSDYIKEFGK